MVSQTMSGVRTEPVRLVRQATVLNQTQLSRSTLYELINSGKFPKPLKLCGGRINVWPEAEIESWIADRLAER